jgi:hypothetical protein
MLTSYKTRVATISFHIILIHVALSIINSSYEIGASRILFFSRSFFSVTYPYSLSIELLLLHAALRR